MVDLLILIADVVLIVLYTWTYFIIRHRMKQANIHIRKISHNLKLESVNSKSRNKTRAKSNSDADDGEEADSPTTKHQQVVNSTVAKSARSINKGMKTLPWFPIVFVCQWSLFLMWKLILAQTWSQTMATVTITNMGGMFNVIVFYRLLEEHPKTQKLKKKH